MNIYQRIILILCAVALIIAFLTSPKLTYTSNGHRMAYRKDAKIFYSTIDYNTAILRISVVIGSTLFLFFALKKIKK